MNLGQVVIADQARTLAGGVPGGTRGQLAFLDEQAIGAACFSEVVKQPDAHDSATNDDDSSMRLNGDLLMRTGSAIYRIIAAWSQNRFLLTSGGDRNLNAVRLSSRMPGPAKITAIRQRGIGVPLEMNREVFITCPVTGSGGTQDKSPHVPRTPKEIADSAIEAAKAGAAIVHCHVRDPRNRQAFATRRPVS